MTSWTCEVCGQKGHTAKAHEARPASNNKTLKTVGIIALTLLAVWVGAQLLDNWETVAAIWNA